MAKTSRGIPLAYAAAAQDDDDDFDDTPVVTVDANEVELIEIPTQSVQEATTQEPDGIMRQPTPTTRQASRRRRVVVRRPPQPKQDDPFCGFCIMFFSFLSTMCFLLASMLDTSPQRNSSPPRPSAKSNFANRYNILDYGYPDPCNRARMYTRKDLVLLESDCARKCSRYDAYAFFVYEQTKEYSQPFFDARVSCLCFGFESLDHNPCFRPYHPQEANPDKAFLGSKHRLGPTANWTIKEKLFACCH